MAHSAGKENIMRKYYVTEATIARINAAKAVKSDYMTLLLPGEGKVMKTGDDEGNKTVIGGLGKIADTGEVFQAPLPFETDELAEESEEIAVNTLQFDKMIECCGRTGGGTMEIVAEDGVISFRCGSTRGSIRYFSTDDVPFKPGIETKDEPLATFVLKSEAVASRVRFISSYANTAIDLRVTPEGEVKFLPDLANGSCFAESVFKAEELIDLDYKKVDGATDFAIPAKYREFFTLPVYGERMTVKFYKGAFEIKSNGTTFKGALSSGAQLIPESILKKLSIKQCEAIAVFFDRAKFAREVSVSTVWSDIIGQSTQVKVMKVDVQAKDDIRLAMTDSFGSVISADNLKKTGDASGEFYLQADSLGRAASSFAGDTLAVGFGNLKTANGMGSILILMDGDKGEKKIDYSGNRAVFTGAPEDKYREMCDTVTAKGKKTPLAMAEEAEKEAEKKAAEKKAAKKPGKK